MSSIHLNDNRIDTLKDLFNELSQNERQLLLGKPRVLPPRYLELRKERKTSEAKRGEEPCEAERVDSGGGEGTEPTERLQKERKTSDIESKQRGGSEFIFLDLENHADILDHDVDDQVISVETGIELKALDKHLQKNNQWFPISGFTGQSTLLEVINSGDGGLLEHGFGGPRDLVLGLHVATATGDLIRTGGKVVKNVTGYDLTKLFIGSQATLGLPWIAHLRLFARPSHSVALALSGRLPEELLTCLESLAGLTLSSCELVDLRLWKNVSDAIHLKKIFSAGANSVLFVQLHGHKEVVHEIKTQIMNERTYGVIDSIILPPPNDTEISEKLSEMKRLVNLNCLELSLSPRLIFDFFRSLWKTSGSPPFQCRPSSGRLRLFCEAQEITGILKLLKDFSLKKEEPFVVSYPDDFHEFRVCRLPFEDAVSTQLRSNIKARLDPKNVLNPLALI